MASVATSDNRAPAWVVPAMRAGYGARGIVYAIVGVLALLAALRGGQAEGTTGALGQFDDQPWGIAILIVIAVGMFCYAFWRVLAGAMDLEEYGADAKGIVARVGQVVTGLIHAGLGVYAVLLVTGVTSGGGSGDGAETVTGMVMQYAWGRYLVGAAGLVTLGAGLYYFYKAYSQKYREKLYCTEFSEKLHPVLQAGLVAHGVAIGLVGAFLVWAAWTYDADKAGGLGQAFAAVRSATHGQILLALLAAGLVAFAVFLFTNAVYRIVPSRVEQDDGAMTLADRARQKARQAAQ